MVSRALDSLVHTTANTYRGARTCTWGECLQRCPLCCTSRELLPLSVYLVHRARITPVGWGAKDLTLVSPGVGVIGQHDAGGDDQED